jgi:hypothetical protein
VFPALLIVLGAALAFWSWRAGGLLRTAADRVLELDFSDRQRVMLDLTLSFVILAMGAGQEVQAVSAPE